jgi:arylsulfatase A-like enzyme
MADDIGWGDPNAYGLDRGVRTPNLNRLAAEGVRSFTWAEIPEFVRADVLSGQYPEVHQAIRAMRLEGPDSVGSRALR